MEKSRIELLISACKADVIPFNYNPLIKITTKFKDMFFLRAFAIKLFRDNPGNWNRTNMTRSECDVMPLGHLLF